MENTEKPIVFEEMVTALAKPGQAIIDSLTPEKADLWHMASCVPAEAAELAEGQLPFFSGLIDEPDVKNAVEELGDLEFYLERIRQVTGINTEMIGKAFAAACQEKPALVPHGFSMVLLAVSAASGHVFDAVKRHVLYVKPLAENDLAVALGRLELYMNEVRIYTGVTREETLAANIAKLRVRYEKLTYSDAAATARADKAAEANA